MKSSDNEYCEPSLLLDMVGGDREIFLQLTGIFMRDSTEQFAKITLALAQGNLQELGFHSHALKGTVGPLGAELLLAMLIRIEEDCKRQECEFATRTVPEIGRYLEGMREEVTRFIGQNL
ncbi:MAG TPA: Hpt domain-containing protein [Burkholderiaceae bacterium]|jgi:HPt (histidine-containing phosphotransfer) domain-containing protein